MAFLTWRCQNAPRMGCWCGFSTISEVAGTGQLSRRCLTRGGRGVGAHSPFFLRGKDNEQGNDIGNRSGNELSLPFPWLRTLIKRLKCFYKGQRLAFSFPETVSRKRLLVSRKRFLERVSLGKLAVRAQNVVRGSQMRPGKLAVRLRNVVRGSQLHSGKP